MNEVVWPRSEPEEWRGVEITRKQARDLIDEMPPSLSEGFTTALDEAQAECESVEAFYVLVRVVKSDI